MYNVAGIKPAVSIYLFKKKLMDIKIPNFLKILIFFPSFVCCYCFFKLSEITDQLKSLEILILELKAENAVLRHNLTLMSAKSSESTILQNITKESANLDADFYAGLFLLGIFGVYLLYVVFSGSPNGASPTPSISEFLGSQLPNSSSSQNALSTATSNLSETVSEVLISSYPTPPVVENFADFALRNSEKLGKFGTWLQQQPYPLESSFSVIEMSTRSYIYVTTVISDPAFHDSCVSKMQALGLII